MAEAKKTEKVSDPFEILTTFSPDTFKEGYEKLAGGVSDFADFQRDSVEAVIKSAGAFAKGIEKLTNEQATFAKETFEAGASTAKAAASSNSVQEAFDVQSDFMRTTVEKNLNQINRVAELFVETSKETAAPISERYGAFVEKIQAFRP